MPQTGHQPAGRRHGRASRQQGELVRHNPRSRAAICKGPGHELPPTFLYNNSPELIVVAPVALSPAGARAGWLRASIRANSIGQMSRFARACASLRVNSIGQERLDLLVHVHRFV